MACKSIENSVSCLKFIINLFGKQTMHPPRRQALDVEVDVEVPSVAEGYYHQVVGKVAKAYIRPIVQAAWQTQAAASAE